MPGGRDPGLPAGHRRAAGDAKWAYGFWQSASATRPRAGLLGVLDTYRKNRWPLDNIVQDWLYWPEDQWGSHAFDPQRFPDPRAWSMKCIASTRA